MSLTEPAYEDLVRRMERLAVAAPRAYRWRVLLLAGVGYLYLILLVAGLIGLIAVTAIALRQVPWLLAKAVLVLGALLVVVLRSLWVRIQPPRGELVTRREAPQLFARLDGLCRRLRAPRIHQVIVTEQLNAAVTQVPRLGVFGWYRNYLLLGLPLMKCLSVPQLEAVLGHELGHLSRGHARIGNWIYRLRLAWLRLDAALTAQPRWGAEAIRAFLRWYIPYFNACSFPFARQNEFEADASAVQLTSPAAAAQALTAVEVMGHYLQERYWPKINTAARDSAQPAFAPFAALNATALEEIEPETARGWLASALARPSTYHDTHPSLKARLEAMGVAAQLAPPAADTASDRLLGKRGLALAATFDDRWRERVSPAWQKHFEETQKKRARLQGLREQSAQAALTPEISLELAALEEDIGAGPAVALALRREVVTRLPQSNLAQFVLARQLLQQSDAEGVALMESAMQQEPDARLAGSQLLRDYWWRQGDEERARQWHAQALKREAELRAGRAERERVTSADRWLEHGLPPGVQAVLKARLQRIAGLECAYLVRKRVRHLPEKPLFVLGYRSRGSERAGAIMQELREQVTFPGETLLLNLKLSANAAFRKEFERVAQAQIL
jgi:Zn-dependent protease with chaperone function